MANHSLTTMPPDASLTAHRLEGAAWGLFFIWIGTAFLLHVDWGVGLLGVGILMVGKQMARKYMGLPLEIFWIAVGAVFILASIWQALSVRVSLLAIICIASGVALLFSAMTCKAGE